MNWFRWLGDQLGGIGYEVAVLQMPNAQDPVPDEWVGALDKAIGLPDKQTLLIGHSLGAHAILRYLESMKSGQVGAAILVAPWPNLNKIKDSSYSRVAKRWMAKEPGWRSIRNHVDRVVAVFSDSDPFVLQANSREFEMMLGAKIILLAGKGHIVDETIETVFDEIKSSGED